MRAALWALLLVACGAAPRPPVESPRSTEPLPSARVEIPPTETLALPYDAPFVHITAGELEGLAYAEIVLGEVPAEAPLPLVVALHGIGDAPRFPAGTVLRTGVPMRLILPRGPLPYGGFSAWSTHRVRDGESEALVTELGDAADRIARLTDALARSRATAGTPIVTGFSQGAMVAWLAAVRHPTSFGLAIVAAGWLPHGAVGSGCPSALRVVHGTADPIVAIEPARAAAAALAARGCAVEWRELPGGEHLVDAALNDVLEGWLEEALAERLPDAHGGIGARGPEPEPYVPLDTPRLLLSAE